MDSCLYLRSVCTCEKFVFINRGKTDIIMSNPHREERWDDPSGFDFPYLGSNQRHIWPILSCFAVPVSELRFTDRVAGSFSVLLLLFGEACFAGLQASWLRGYILVWPTAVVEGLGEGGARTWSRSCPLVLRL